MAQSKTIKDQASSAKRMATSISKIIEQLDWEKTRNNSEGISAADRITLTKAASILSKIGSVKSQVAKKAKSAEMAKEQAIKKASAEAKNIIAGWEGPKTNLDKIALVTASDYGYSFEAYLKKGLSLLNREATSEDWRQMLDELVSEAYKSIPVNAAYSAITSNKPISEVMSTAAEKLIDIKKQPRTLSLAKEWAAKINP